MTNKAKGTVRATEETVGNRVLLSLLCCFVALAALIYIGRVVDSIDLSESGRYLAFTLIISVPALIFACGIFYLLKNLKNPAAAARTFSPSFVFWITAILFACGVFMRVVKNVSRTNEILFVVIPVITLLYIVYNSFQREAFTLAVATAAETGALLVFYKRGAVMSQGLAIALAVIFAALTAAFLVFCILTVKKSDGKLPIFGRRLKLFSPGAAIAPFCIVCAISVLGFAAALLFGYKTAFYALIVLLAAALFIAIYYIVKMAAAGKN